MSTPTLNHLLRMPAPSGGPGLSSAHVDSMNAGGWGSSGIMPPPAQPPTVGHRAVTALKGGDTRPLSPRSSPAPGQARQSPVSPAQQQQFYANYPAAEQQPQQGAPVPNPQYYYQQQARPQYPTQFTPYGQPTQPQWNYPQQYPQPQPHTTLTPAPQTNGPSTPYSQPQPTPTTPQPKTPQPQAAKQRDSSMPSTPGTPVAPNDDSLGENSGMASPAWNQNSMSPSVGQRTPGPGADNLTTPKTGSSTPQVAQAPLPVPADIVDRLAGMPSVYPPHEYQRRVDFYKSLCTFLSRKGEPLTGPPQVSKQTVDLYTFYYAVHDKGGFEMVMKTKAWKQLCPIVPALQESSAAGYQLRKHYAKYLLEFECHFSPRGRSAAELIDMAEKQKKTKVRKRDRHSPDGPDTPGPTAGVPYAGGEGSQQPPQHFIQQQQQPGGGYPEGHPPQWNQQQGWPGAPPQQRFAGPQPDGTAPSGEMVARDPFDERTAPSAGTPVRPPGQTSAAGTYYPPYGRGGVPVTYQAQPAYGAVRPASYPQGQLPYRPPTSAVPQRPPMQTQSPAQPIPTGNVRHPYYGYYRAPYPAAQGEAGAAQAATPPYVVQQTSMGGPGPGWQQQPQSGVVGPPARFGTPTTAAYDGRDARTMNRTPQAQYRAMNVRDMRQMGRKETHAQSVFPAGSVEATPCSVRRRRKIVAKDVGKVDPWRTVMALKSGLAAETSWALNVLNILLYDDSTVSYFGLKNLPGLLEVLVELFRRSLCEVFPEEQLTSIEHDCVTPFPDPDPKLIPIDVALAEHKLDPETLALADDKKVCERMTGKSCASKLTRVEFVAKRRRLDPGDQQRETLDSNGILTSASWEMGGGLTTDHLSTKFSPQLCLEYKDKSAEKRVPINEPPEIEQPKFFLSDCTEAKARDPELKGSVKTVTTKALIDRNDYMLMNIRTCLAVSNVIRGLSFVPGNELEMCEHAGLLHIIGRLIKLYHYHVQPKDGETREQLHIDTSLWECVQSLREDSLVIVCQLSAHIDLMNLDELVVRTLMEGLLHWVVCPCHETKDPLPPGQLSPLKYTLETLCKMSVMENNVDLILATPPWRRTETLVEVLASLLSLGEEVVVREFALVLLHALCSGSEAVCAHAGLHTPAVHHLVSFIEEHDTNLHLVLNQRGMPALRENPELMGTSVGMLRRAAGTLHCLSKIWPCRDKFARHQQRLLQFTMSQLMDSRVAAIIAETLYELQSAIEEAKCKPKQVNKETVAEVESTGGDENEQLTNGVDSPVLDNATLLSVVAPVKRVVGSKCAESQQPAMNNCKTRVLAE